uniref:Uncharacterized protein n=1 Tax=Strigamia maritima TaxID=126957 RepID=T1IXN5_STRMM
MLGYVASCLGLSPTVHDQTQSTEPVESSRKKALSEIDVNAAAAAASSYAAAADIKSLSPELVRISPINSSEKIVSIKSEKNVVKLPTRLFISRRSAHRSEFFINLSAKKGKETTVCLSEGNLPFRLSPFEGQLSVVRKRRRYQSDTMNQKPNGCDIPRPRTNNRRRSSRSPGCYFCEADAYAALAAAGWTCTTTETMVPSPDEVQYLYHMPYFPQVQTYQPYPVEFDAQYVEYAHAPSPAFISYPPSSPQPKLSQVPPPRTVVQCQPCPPCPQCPLTPSRLQRSPTKLNAYDRGLCESADMTPLISDTMSPGRSRSVKKTNTQYYSIPFEDVTSQFPSRSTEGDDEEERRWKASRQRLPKDWKDFDSFEMEQSSNSSAWNQLPMTNESRVTYSPSRYTSEEIRKESPRGRRSPSVNTSKGHCRPSSLASSTRSNSKMPSESRLKNTETQTSVGFSKEFLSEEDEQEQEEEPASVATQTSLQVVVIDRKKDQAGGDIEKTLSKQRSTPERRLSPVYSPSTSPRPSPSPRPSAILETSETSQKSGRLSPTVEDPEPAVDNDVSSQQEDGTREEAGRDSSPTMSFSTGSESFCSQYMTPPLIFPEANNALLNSTSPCILGELSTELQSLAIRVALLEQKRSMGNSGTFIPEVSSEPIETVEPITVWHKDITKVQCEDINRLRDGEEENEEEDDDTELVEECALRCYDRSPSPSKMQRHTCSFSDMDEASWQQSDSQTSGFIINAAGESVPVSNVTKESFAGGWCSSNVGIARSSPNLHSASRLLTRTPTVSTSNEEYIISGHELETVRMRTGGMVAVQAMPMHQTLGLGSSHHWKKLHMDVGVGDWDFVNTTWSAGLTGLIEESKNLLMTKEGGERGENYHAVPPPPPPPSPILSPVGDGAVTESDHVGPFKESNFDQIMSDEAESIKEKVVDDEGRGGVEKIDDVEVENVADQEEEEAEEAEEVEKVVDQEEVGKVVNEDENSNREHSSTPFLLDSVLFPPMKHSPSGTPFIPSMENLRKRCVISKGEVEKASSSTQTLMKTSLDSDQLQLFSAFQRVVVLGESRLDEGLGLMDSVAIEIDLCRLDAITHIAYVVVVVCLFLLLTTILSYFVN